MGLAAAVGLKEGPESSAFAIAVVFACVVSVRLSRA
jgi:acid phosphatase family membrane protein YuiD